MRIFAFASLPLLALAAAACGGSAEHYDVLLRGGTVFDGSGTPGFHASVALRGDRIAAVGDLDSATADVEIDATGLAVTPGFINMLSWSNQSLIQDGRSLGEIMEGVTTQVMGEGTSMGPLTPEMKSRWKAMQGDITFDYTWTTLAEYLQFLERKGVSQNVASFIGAGTIREHVIGHDNRPPTAAELDQMRALVREEMEAGALGIGSSLIYAPDNFASTEELIELCKVAAQYKGKYISHIRSEANQLVEAVDEVIRISREADIPAEIYHLKAAGEANWPKMDRVIEMIEAARAEGLRITADMYTLHGRIDGSQCRDAAVGARRGLCRVLCAARPAGRARAHQAGHDGAGHRLGEPLPGGRLGRPRAAGGIQERGPQAPHRQNARRGGRDARHGPVRHHPRSHARGRDARRRRVLPDVGRERAQADRVALGVVRIGRRVDGPRRRLPEVVDAPARVRQLRPAAGQGTCARNRSSRSKKPFIA